MYARQIESQSQQGIDIIREKGLTLRYIGLNSKTKPFNNPKVRRAISLSINRKQLVEKLLSGYGDPANQLVPQAVFGYNPSLPAIPYDTIQANKLLSSAGYPNGIDLSMLISGARQSLGEELQRQMGPAGIRLSFNVLEPGKFLAALDTCSFFVVGSVSNSGDVSDQFDDVIHSQKNGYGRENKGRYYNPQVDLLIEKSSGYFDSSQRLQALQEIMALVMQDPPRIPLYFEDEIYGISKGVEWHPRLDMLVLGKEARIRTGHAEFK
jgi:peptide/nickel transport system substrate-binding protein